MIIHSFSYISPQEAKGSYDLLLELVQRKQDKESAPKRASYSMRPKTAGANNYASAGGVPGYSGSGYAGGFRI